jgi:hypothetical protein
MLVHVESVGHTPHDMPHRGSGPQVRPLQSGTQAGQVPHVEEVDPQAPARDGSMSAHDAGRQIFVPAAKPILGPPLMTHADPTWQSLSATQPACRSAQTAGHLPPQPSSILPPQEALAQRGVH